MTGMDGINSLQKMLGALKGNDATNVNGTAAANAKGASTAISGGTVLSGSSVDRTSLSAAASQATSDTSDVRLTKVAELRQAIASGTYNVSASAVADKMVESMLG